MRLLLIESKTNFLRVRTLTAPVLCPGQVENYAACRGTRPVAHDRERGCPRRCND